MRTALSNLDLVASRKYKGRLACRKSEETDTNGMSLSSLSSTAARGKLVGGAVAREPSTSGTPGN